MKTLFVSLLAVCLFSGGAVVGGKIGLNNLVGQIKENQVKRSGGQNAELQMLLAQL